MGTRSTSVAALYDSARDFFVDHDSWLPEVQINGVEPGEAQVMFALLVQLGDPLRPAQTVWDRERDQERAISEFSEPGRLAAEGRLESLHLVLTGVRWRDCRLPDLGVSVWPHTVALDYRTGRDWSADKLAGFIDLLCVLRDLARRGQFVLAGETSLPLPDNEQLQFRQAVDQYHARRT